MSQGKYLKPHFLIMGEQKCGTSSLYRYLVTHPRVLPCQLKEPQFFSQPSPEIAAHIEDYWALFPTREYQGDLSFIWPELNAEGRIYHLEVQKERSPHLSYYTGEASANTFREVDPLVLKEYLPGVRLMLLLRNPVDRAFSLHRMFRRFQAEGREQGFAVHDFETDIRAELEGKPGRYLGSSLYINYLPRWVEVFGWEQIRVVLTEELGNPALAPGIMADLLAYLELPEYDYGDLLQHRFNRAVPAEMDAGLRRELEGFFAEANEKLARYLGRNLW
jgi:hypothetical protein